MPENLFLCDPKTIPLDLIAVQRLKEETQDEKKKDKEKWMKNPYKKEDFAVYEYLGQHISPQRETWVQYMGGAGGPEGNAFAGADNQTRNRFVMIVFSIVLILLFITMAFNIAVFYVPTLNMIFNSPLGLYLSLGSAAGVIALGIVVSCSSCVQYAPGNYIVLIICLVCMCILSAYSTVRAGSMAIILALLATLLVVMLCIMIACTSWDFTKYMTFAIVIALAFFVLALICTVVMMVLKIKIKLLTIVLLVVGTLIQSFLMIITMQMILGGKTVAFDEDAYIIAAYMVYSSVVSMFIRLLKLILLLTGDDDD